ncbi:MAG TPA: HlyD family efflux transporter periplasmic adaptor subunit [Geminicoccaceae bacterium]|nr:HlyD family efflux transporter periplasmic adaptor subunit [Geminicoccaceae bacterium]
MAELLAGLGQWLGGLLVTLGLVAGPGPAVHQGYVEGEYLLLAAPVAGTLDALHVRRGESVAAGAPLFALDPTRAAADCARAGAVLAEARAALADLEKGKRPEELEVIRAMQAQTEAELELARVRLGREETLSRRAVSAADRLDEARAEVRRLEGRRQELAAELEVAALPARADAIRAAEAAVARAEAELVRARHALLELAPVAPAAAFVEDTFYEPGEWVEANRPVVSLLPPDALKLRFFVPQAVVGSLALGQELRFACDGCPGDQRARVSFIARRAEYTPPVIYSVGSRQKLVFMVEARPLGDVARLHPGQPVDVTLGP